MCNFDNDSPDRFFGKAKLPAEHLGHGPLSTLVFFDENKKNDEKNSL